VLMRGACLRPAEIGLLAALNRTHASAHRRPRVAILATGDELVDPGQEAGPGQIRNSNTPMVEAMVRQCGGEPRVLGAAGDTTADLRAKLSAARGADLLITTGGVSVGDYDVVKDVLRLEGRIDLWQVRMKPGKPLAFGELSGVPLLGLPGNPVAAAVAFEQFARPAIRAMLGHRDLMRPTVRARLASRVENHGGRRQFVPVRVEAAADGFVANPSGSPGAGSLAALTRANGLLVVPETMAVAAAGDLFPVQLLDWEA
nr:molybdopterin molybdotransferase MoeA [Chloroflexia bacterium]